MFHQNSGTFKKGQVVAVKDIKDTDQYKSAGHFGVFRSQEMLLAAGDSIRITHGCSTGDGHRLDNGAIYEVKGFDDKGRIVLANGWTLPENFGHLAHGYVRTSVGSQGRTVDRVLVAMGSESRGALNAEQFYVSLSRAKFEARVYTDLPPEELKQAIQRTDTRKSATELMKPKSKPKKAARLKCFMEKAKDRFMQLREMAAGAIKEREHEHERDYARER